MLAVGCWLLAAALTGYRLRRRKPLPFSGVLNAVTVFLLATGASDCLAIADLAAAALYMRWLGGIAAIVAGGWFALSLPRLLAARSSEELAEANQRLREELAVKEQAEEELQRALNELSGAVHELEQFAYITSHDLQAPLRTISGFSQLLIHRYRDRFDGDGLEFLDYIDKGTRQMQTLIQDLLALSRVGRADPSAFERRPLGDSVSKAVQALQEQINRSGAEIVFGALPEVAANHGLMQQLLHNLIGNAIKFQKTDTKPRVQIGIERNGDFWDLTVADNGIGIPHEQLESIFTIFRRLHAPESYEGTGIGLAICKKIVSYHNGEIWATSDETGSCFHVRLPVTPNPHRRIPSTKPTSARPALALV